MLAKGYKVVAAPNPLRGVSSDAAYVSSFLNTIDGPIILVGHSYGGAVITNAASGNQSVKALVYVAAFAPDAGRAWPRCCAAFPAAPSRRTRRPPFCSRTVARTSTFNLIGSGSSMRLISRKPKRSCWP
ncbi:MAG: alpha/beta fold hydrolase [Alphaproteobacteria bacterium]|nr:MAG: alpha/beta fold hydrolase [Alphaproteobacteria bacterium]